MQPVLLCKTWITDCFKRFVFGMVVYFDISIDHRKRSKVMSKSRSFLKRMTMHLNCYLRAEGSHL